MTEVSRATILTPAHRHTYTKTGSFFIHSFIHSSSSLAPNLPARILIDWEIWTAAIVTNTAVRDIFISAVKNWVSDGQNNRKSLGCVRLPSPVCRLIHTIGIIGPFGDLYDTVSGAWVGFSARPVVGGHLALVRIHFHFLRKKKEG
jgi:hypothetical protein